MRRHAALAMLVMVLVAMVGPTPASAGGTFLRPVRDRYAGGDLAVLVGYTEWPIGTSLPAFQTYLRATRHDGPVGRGQADVPLGPLRMERTGHGGYLAVRASITFRVPTDLGPLRYEVMICHDDCPGVAGTIIGGELWVGVDPAYPVAREWALDDPEIANLAPGAVLTGPGYETTAAAVRAGRAPASARFGDGRPPLAAEPEPGRAVPAISSPPSARSEARPSPAAPARPAGAAMWLRAVLALTAGLATAAMVVLTRRALVATAP